MVGSSKSQAIENIRNYEMRQDKIKSVVHKITKEPIRIEPTVETDPKKCNVNKSMGLDITIFSPTSSSMEASSNRKSFSIDSLLFSAKQRHQQPPTLSVSDLASKESSLLS